MRRLLPALALSIAVGFSSCDDDKGVVVPGIPMEAGAPAGADAPNDRSVASPDAAADASTDGDQPDAADDGT